MDSDKILTVAAMAVIGLVLLVAVSAAGFMIISSLGGSPSPSPTPVPTTVRPTPTPYVIIPSGPVTAVPTTTTAIPTAVQPIVKSADLVGYGTDKDTYKRGDMATTYITIENTGTVPIDAATLNIKVDRYVSVMGYVNVQSPTTTLTDLDIEPGQTKKAEYQITIPVDYEGVSTAGKYRFTIEVLVWNTKIGEFSKEVTVE